MLTALGPIYQRSLRAPHDGIKDGQCSRGPIGPPEHIRYSHNLFLYMVILICLSRSFDTDIFHLLIVQLTSSRLAALASIVVRKGILTAGESDRPRDAHRQLSSLPHQPGLLSEVSFPHTGCMGLSDRWLNVIVDIDFHLRLLF